MITPADGTMLGPVAPGSRPGQRPRPWQAMRLVAAQANDRVTTVDGATLGSVSATGRRWGPGPRAAGWGKNRRRHAVGEGADWIRWPSREVFGTQGCLPCDDFHVSEDLAAAAASGRPAPPDQWRHTQQQRLKAGKVAKVIASLLEPLEAEGTPAAEAPVRNGHRYLSHRRDGWDDPLAWALGLPTGSGMIESGHRPGLQARLKQAGAAWGSDHADRIAHLRVLRANHPWLSIWN